MTRGRITERDYVEYERTAIQLEAGVADTDLMFPAAVTRLAELTRSGPRDTDSPIPGVGGGAASSDAGLAYPVPSSRSCDELSGNKQGTFSRRNLAPHAGFSSWGSVLDRFADGLPGPFRAVTLNAHGASDAELRRSLASFARRCHGRGPLWVAVANEPGTVPHAHCLAGFELARGDSIRIWRAALRNKVLARSSDVRECDQRRGGPIGWLQYSTRGYDEQRLAAVQATGSWRERWARCLRRFGLEPAHACGWCLRELDAGRKWCSHRCSELACRAKRNAIIGAVSGVIELPERALGLGFSRAQPDPQSDALRGDSAAPTIRYVQSTDATAWPLLAGHAVLLVEVASEARKERNLAGMPKCVFRAS